MVAEGAAGDLGQVAELGSFADPHHPFAIEVGIAAVVVGVIGAARDDADGGGLRVAGVLPVSGTKRRTTSGSSGSCTVISWPGTPP